MARLMVRSKSHQKLREDAQRAAIKTREPVSNETAHARPVLSPPASKYASPSPASTPSFEVLSRPKTASAAMEEARKRNLMTLGDPISVTDGKETFNFPTPAQAGLPPLMSRYANSPLAARPNLERSNTPETIGIALGSPSHLAQFESQVAENMNERVMAWSKESSKGSKDVTPAATPRLGEGPEQKIDDPAAQAAKPKVSRWKSIFGRKTQQPRELRSQDERSPLPGLQPRSGLGVNSYHTWEAASPRSPRLRSETMPQAAVSPQAPLKSPRWNLGRSQTAPTGRRNANSPTVPPKDFLAVEIPETKMERYSIMFNGILPNQPGGLLARRQSKRESKSAKLAQPATLEDLDIPPVPLRRNTNTASPSASPSYRLLVFPPSTNTPSPKPLERKTSLMHRPRPLKRSKTAPGALSPGLRSKMGPLSPMSEMSESGETDMDTEPASGTPHNLDHDDDKRDELDRQALTPTPSEPSTPNTPEDSNPIIPIPTYLPFQSEHARKSSTNLSMLAHEPDWAMITIGKLAEPGDRFSGAQVRVLEEPSPVERSAPARIPGSVVPIPSSRGRQQMAGAETWHPLRMNSLVDKSKASAAAERARSRAQAPQAAAQSPAPAPAQPQLRHAPTASKSTATTTTRQRGLSNTPRPDLTATMATQRLPAKGEVQIARSMSVTKARPVGLRTSPRGVEKGKGENLVERQALVPRLVENPAPPAGAGSGTGRASHRPARSLSASIVEEGGGAAAA